ncbi:MAG: hypothetical protein M3209_14885 [Acidobacteriota bacterium]|nr:hypothetical protein [Acidobacteriota bacterium]
MKKLLNFKIVSAVLLCLFLFEVSAEAQRRRTTPAKRRTTTTRRTTTPPPTPVSLAARNAAILPATEKVSNQIKNLAQFILLMGNTVPVIQQLEASNSGGAASQSARAQAETGKKSLISAITIFKNAMGTLEDEFRASPVLRPYLVHLVGVSEHATTAEQQAAAGQFNQAGRTLLLVVNQLADVLREMP